MRGVSDATACRAALVLPPGQPGRVAGLTWLVRPGEPFRAGTDLVEFADGTRLGAAVEGRVVQTFTTAGMGLAPGAVLAELELGEAPAAPAAQLVVLAPDETLEGGVLATPEARLLARRLGVDLVAIEAGASDGRILEDDVRAAGRGRPRPGQDAPDPATIPELHSHVAVVPLRGRLRERADTARRAGQAPTFTLMVRLDAGTLLEFRDDGAPRPSLTALFAWALAAVVPHHPRVNDALVDGFLHRHDEVHVGVAVATEADLATVVLRRVEQATLAGIDAALAAGAGRARAGRLSRYESEGATIGLINLGALGIDTGTPLLVPPAATAVQAGRISAAPWVAGGNLAVRPVLELALSFDQRVVDGLTASRFAGDLRGFLASPDELARHRAHGPHRHELHLPDADH